MGIMNVATYGYTMVAARVLGPQPFGAFASMMNLLIVVSVLSLALQTTAARRIASHPDHVTQIERDVMRVTIRVALLLGVLLTTLAPLVDLVLKLESLSTAALLGVAAAPATIMGGQAGVLQGERRWAPLSVLYLSAGVPRLLIGTAMVLWRPEEFSAILAVAIASWAPVVVGWLALRRPRTVEPSRGPAGHSSSFGSIVRELLHNSQALLAFFALSNADLVVARNVLTSHDSGLYAGGLILTKSVLFLPQFVVVVAFPSMATASQRRRTLAKGLVITATLGSLATLATLVLPEVALIFVGGPAYAEIQARLWLWGLLGTVLAMLQLLVYALLARRSQRTTLVFWIALLVVTAIGLTTSSINSLLAIVLCMDVITLGLLVAAHLRRSRGARSDPDRPHEA